MSSPVYDLAEHYVERFAALDPLAATGEGIGGHDHEMTDFSPDGAAERATTAGLNMTANSFEVGYSTLGMRAASLIPIGDGMALIPRASAAWQHAFNSVTPDATVAFQNVAGSFVVAGVTIARDSLLAEAGLDLAISRSATIGVSYTGQIASSVADHAAKGRFSWKFN